MNYDVHGLRPQLEQELFVNWHDVENPIKGGDPYTTQQNIIDIVATVVVPAIDKALMMGSAGTAASLPHPFAAPHGVIPTAPGTVFDADVVLGEYEWFDYSVSPQQKYLQPGHTLRNRFTVVTNEGPWLKGQPGLPNEAEVKYEATWPMHDNDLWSLHDLQGKNHNGIKIVEQTIRILLDPPAGRPQVPTGVKV